MVGRQPNVWYIILVGYKHLASKGVFYLGGRGCVLCQFIEPVTFARCEFIFALWNIALGGYLDTRRNIYGMTVDLKYIIYIIISKFKAIEHTRMLVSLAIN